EISHSRFTSYATLHLLSSNDSVYVNRYSSLFEQLWDNGIDAVTRIRDIEEGIDLANIEIIQNPQEGIKPCLESNKNCKGRSIDNVFNTKRFS
ncbi:MAG: hypothetical protein WCF23_17150, partial [Candidatus Nitrosopolaris sp.]